MISTAETGQSMACGRPRAGVGAPVFHHGTCALKRKVGAAHRPERQVKLRVTLHW
jgi:hypothetical protein